MKQIIRITESDLHKIVKEQAKKIISEGLNEDETSYTFDYSELCDLYEKMAEIFKQKGIDIKIIHAGLMPLHYLIKRIEYY